MRIQTLIAAVLTTTAAWAKLTSEQVEMLPPPAENEVIFTRDVQPILEASCVNCHGRGKAKGGFAIDTRESFLKGGDSGAGAVAGKSAESLVIELVSGLDPDNIMPQKGSKLTTEQVGILRRWIDDGLPWDDGVTFGKVAPKNLVPRDPAVPEVAGVEHPVDRFVWAQFKERSIEAKRVVDDRTYARRVYLDVIGLLPTPEELARFVNDPGRDKRTRLVGDLLDRDFDYAAHWLTFWNDLLRNDYKGTGYIDGGRKQITSWLFSALATNKRYNEFVAELVNPGVESEGFSKGIIWRGVVNASQTPEMQAAQNISQVFMGVNLKCASCHDSFINDWTLADAYNLASVYAEAPLEMYECDAPTGRTAGMKFIYPDLGEIDPKASRKDRLKQLAGAVTSEQNGRLTRTMVNRLWARFFGRGLIEPVDEMEGSAWNQDLLDWLAADFAKNGYDLKRTIELMVTSAAYQLPSVPASEREREDFVFRGPVVRRLSAEQFVDGIAQITGVAPGKPAAKIDFAASPARGAGKEKGAAKVSPKWIWSDPQAATKAEASTVYVRRFLEVPFTPAEGNIVIACDNSFTLYINGIEAGKGRDISRPASIDIRKYLQPGINLFAVAARNWAGAPNAPESDQRNPAGLWIYGRVTGASDRDVVEFGSDRTWLWNISQPEGWQRAEYPAVNWSAAAELGDKNMAPWALAGALDEAVAGLLLNPGAARASLLNNDALLLALGRPNREQVVTSRASAATTLQALELTNGSTLSGHLAKGAGKLAEAFGTPGEFVTAMYERALNRKPSPAELRASEELLGERLSGGAVEDFLWAVTMLPEFQLIY